MNKLVKVAVTSISQHIRLADGHTMPLFGLGCWNLSQEEAYNSVCHALKVGYRLFDTAAMYKNENAVGEALNDCELKRHEYFVVTKLSPDNHGYNKAKENLKISLKKLGLAYVDLYLIHTPKPGRNIETWKAFVELKKEGYAKSVGVSNYNSQHLEGLKASGLEIPVINQIEHHPWYQQRHCADYCSQNNITLMGYCPLARGQLFDKTPLLAELSEKYKKSRAQISLRWALQTNVVTIPRTSKMERIEENANVFDFTLSEEEMVKLRGLTLEKHISMSTNVMKQPWVG